MPGGTADDLTHQIGVVPRCESLDFPDWQQTCDQAGFWLISLIETPADVLAAARTRVLVSTESLHGAILADAPGIPGISFISTRNICAFKRMDWCLSANVTFAPEMITPLPAEAALTLGRPVPVPRAQRRAYDAEAAFAEYRARVKRARSRHPIAAHRLIEKPLLRGMRHLDHQARRIGRLVAA
jgi:succinoglycan biosynthesis protein ExoV